MKLSAAIELYQKIFDEQEKKDRTSKHYGLWPSDIMMPDNPLEELGTDYNILLGLQILLMLLDISKKTFLPNFEQIQDRFNIALSSFISDTEESGRPSGYIAFWPYIKYSQTESKHNFDPKNVTFSHMDIKNDSGDSALAAIYLMEIGKHADHVTEYAHRLSSKDFENGFYTFLPALNYSGGIDLIDNIHILSAIQMLKKNHPDLVCSQLLKNEENAIKRTRKILESSLIERSLLYYRRISQFLFVFTKQKYDGLSPFNESDYSIVDSLLKQEIQRQNFCNDYDLVEQLELLLSCKFSHYPRDFEHNIDDVQLFETLETILFQPAEEINKLSIGEYTSFIARSGFINTVIYNKFVGWYATSHITALSLLYLTWNEHLQEL